MSPQIVILVYINAMSGCDYDHSVIRAYKVGNIVPEKLVVINGQLVIPDIILEEAAVRPDKKNVFRLESQAVDIL
jgi:hypothetical protein